MQNLFTIDQLFDQMFPWLSGISWDLGTILSAMLLLWFLVLGFDWVKMMFFGNLERRNYRKWSERYTEAAEQIRQGRDTMARGSAGWLAQDMAYKEMLRKSARAQVKGYDYD